MTFTAKGTERYLRVGFAFQDDSQINPNDVENPQLIGISITPIPLPSRGWVAGLPDGTADELSVDGAGKVVWELEDDEVVLDGSNDESWDMPDTDRVRYRTLAVRGIVRNVLSGTEVFNGLCTKYRALSPNDTYLKQEGIAVDKGGYIVVYDPDEDLSAFIALLQSYPMTVLYPLATHVTEDCGYIDLPDMQDCVLSIPELDALGVRYTIGDGAEIARQWYARAHSEYEQRITDLEEAVAELTAGA
jgi:hypothetical protein